MKDVGGEGNETLEVERGGGRGGDDGGMGGRATQRAGREGDPPVALLCSCIIPFFIIIQEPKRVVPTVLICS